MRSGIFSTAVIVALFVTCFSPSIFIGSIESNLEPNEEISSAVKNSSSEGPGIEFGAESGSIFNIDPDSSIGINVNFSSQIESHNEILLAIDWPQSWSVSWNHDSSPDVGREYNVSPGQLIWVGFTISSPPVIGGNPLSQSLHHFSMSISSIEGNVIDWYNFSLRYGNYDGVEIIRGGGTSSISAGGSVTLETVVRNTGNSIRSLEIEIVALGDDGSEISESGTFFSTGTWSASVIERWRVEDLAPNATGSVLVQVFSPSEIEEALTFEIRIWSPGNSANISSVGHLVNIVSREGGDISILEDGCSSSETIPGDTCEVKLILANTGDSLASYQISASGTPEWVDLEYSSDIIELQSGEFSDAISVLCRVKEGTIYNQNGQISIRMLIEDWSPGEVSFGVKSGALFSWSLEGSEESLEEGNLTIYWTVRNEGNSLDGLTASIDSSIVTEFGIGLEGRDSDILLFNSSRALEIYPISPGEGVTIIGWMEVPTSAPIETNASLSIEIRSVMSPEIFFAESVSVNITGEEVPELDSEKEDIRKGAVEFLNVWLEPTMIFSVTILGILGVFLALKKTSGTLDNGELQQEEEDWMSKFSRSEEAKVSLVVGSEVDVSEFERDFFGDGGRPDALDQNEIAIGEINDASRILDKSKEESDIEEAMRIAEELDSHDLLHPDNIILDIEDYSSFSEERKGENQGPSGFDLEL